MRSAVVLLAAVSLFLGGNLSLACNCRGQGNGAAPVAESVPGDVQEHKSCFHCGMDREKFSRSRMLISYADGTSVGTCSIHCLVTERSATKEKVITKIEVGDYDTRLLIDAENAFWVIGGDQRGVMTRTPKWAFATKDAAEAFIRKHGGSLASYKEALELAEKE